MYIYILLIAQSPLTIPHHPLQSSTAPLMSYRLHPVTGQQRCVHE